MGPPILTALAAEAIVVLVIFLGSAAYVNFGAIAAAIASWGIQ